MSGSESQWTDERLDQMLQDALAWEGDRVVREGPDPSFLMSDLADRLEAGTTVHRYALPLVAVLALALLVTAAVGGMLVWRPVEVPLLPSASARNSSGPSDSPSPPPQTAMPLGAFDRSEMEALLETRFEDTPLVDGLLLYRAAMVGRFSYEFVVAPDTGAIMRSSVSASYNIPLPRSFPDRDDSIPAWFDFLRSIDRETAEWLHHEFTAFSTAPGEVIAEAQFGRLFAEFRTQLNYFSGRYDHATWAVQVTPATQFSGFLPPVGDGLLNVAAAGQAVPLRWRLTDADGNPIVDLAEVGVSVVDLDCDQPATTHLIREYVTRTEAGLQNLGDGYYQYDFAPPLAHSNSCKTLRLNLGEGLTGYPIYRTVDFQFVD